MEPGPIAPIDILGLTAGALTAIAFLPQVVRTWRTRSAADIAPGMILLLIAGISLWLAYGLLKRDIAVIAANAVTLALALTLLALKLAFARSRE